MNQDIKRLIKTKNQWESDINMYKEFLKGKTQTEEGKYGAQEYISMAENRLCDINKKLKEIENQESK
tara:strand:+ start:423 stop:623 length:201 start_codon:yes stop_codon:yes gene_type:complete